jgi:hypothetical protein
MAGIRTASQSTIASVVELARNDDVKNQRFRTYVYLFVIFGAYMTCCTLFYTYYEKWEPSVSLSFVVETMTTVGKELRSTLEALAALI